MIKLLRSYFGYSDFKKFIFLILLLILFTYILPESVKIISYLILLFIFYRSRNNVLWFAIVFVSLDFPGGFLTNENMVMTSLLRGYTFQEAFVLVAFIKCLKFRKPNYPLLLKTGFILMAVYLFFLVIYSMELGFTILKIFRVIRFLFLWSLLYSMPRLLTSDDFKDFFRIIFSLLPIGLIIQFLGLLRGTDLSSILFGSKVSLVDTSSEMLRVVAGVLPAFLGLLGSMIYYRKKIFPQSFLNINIVLSFIFLVSTATRGWVMGFIVAVIFFVLFLRKGRSVIIKGGIVLFVFYFLVSLLSPRLITQFDFATDRLLTVKKIVQGDLTAGGTAGRFDVYAPVMMSDFHKKPFLGYGILDEYSQVSNGHLGYHNLLLQGGIVGFVLFYLFLLLYLLQLFRKYFTDTKQRSGIIGVIAIFAFVLIVNIGSHFIGFYCDVSSHFIQSLLFVLGSALYFDNKARNPQAGMIQNATG